MLLNLFTKLSKQWKSIQDTISTEKKYSIERKWKKKKKKHAIFQKFQFHFPFVSIFRIVPSINIRES